MSVTTFRRRFPPRSRQATLANVGRASLYLFAVLFTVTVFLLAQSTTPTREIDLPSDKSLSAPAPGVFARLNGFAANVALSSDHHYAAILNDGYGTQANEAHESIAILNLSTNQLTDFPESRLGEEARQSYFIGLAFSSDGGHLYASMGSITDPTGEKPGDTGNGIAVYKFEDGKISWERFIKIALQQVASGKKVALGLRKTPPGTIVAYPAGLTVVAGKENDRLLVADNYSDNVLLLDSQSGAVLKQFDLSAHQLIPAEYPYTVVATHDGHRAWCSLWNASRIVELDLDAGKAVRSIPIEAPDDPLQPGSHPSAMLLSHDEKLLYVAASNADLVDVVATESGKVVGVLNRMRREATPVQGLSPSALAQSADGNHIFVAYSALNAVGVFDVRDFSPQSTPHSQSDYAEIPTEWYPTALAMVGNDLLIATSKGEGSGPNSGLSVLKEERRHREHPYIPTLLYGSLAKITEKQLNTPMFSFTHRVLQDNHLQNDSEKIEFAGGRNPIRHVIYIIKENRTYDQILGDLKVGSTKVGNGDPSLTMYGADITPNEHKLALQFGVLDNFYDSGEVSGDGHNWSTAAMTTDYNEKTWQIGYRSRERTYDYQGMVADEFPLENDEPDVDAPATGYLWDNVAAHGLSYRDYGEYMGTAWCKPEGVANPQLGTPSLLRATCQRTSVQKGEPLPSNLGQPHGSASSWPWAVPLFKEVKPTKTVLRDHFDPLFPDFATDYPDQLRADEFLNEFEKFDDARQRGKGPGLPAFVLVYLPDDHTGGTRPGKPRPAASIADNDLAVGRVVDAVSHSPYWNDTAIFIVEDDAQDGADHVDAHRSIAFVISKYSPGSVEHPYVESHFYTTVNMVHTIEALLGVPPMNQNDAYAPVMVRLFTGKGNQPPFTPDWRNRDSGLIYQTNPPHAPGAAESAKMDFTRPDANNAALLNDILWHDRMGDRPAPAPRRNVFAPQPASSGQSSTADDD